MHPLHEPLVAMDGRRAYLLRLLELEAEYRGADTRPRRLVARQAYQLVRRNYCRAYPDSPPPPMPLCLKHR